MQQVKIAVRRVAMAGAIGLTLVACRSDLPPTYRARDARLRRADLLLYPAANSTRAARAVIFFFGNDVGFWAPHRHLAIRLSREGYAVAGLDLPKFLARLPSGEPQRDRAFADSIIPLVAAVHHEFGDSVPLILGGHSFGAEVAVWLARNHEPRGLKGVLALSPRANGHLTITPRDWTDQEPHGNGVFSVVSTERGIDPRVRIALVRGSKDKFAADDPALVTAGGARLRHYVIPFAGHSLKRLLIAGPIIEHAVAYLLRSAPPTHRI